MSDFKMIIIVTMIAAIITGCAEGGASSTTTEPIFSTVNPSFEMTSAVSVLN